MREDKEDQDEEDEKDQEDKEENENDEEERRAKQNCSSAVRQLSGMQTRHVDCGAHTAMGSTNR